MALPATIQTIVALIGHSQTMALVREFGGDNFRFTTTQGSANWESLVEVIGPRATRILCEHFNGDAVYIALCDQALKADRNRRMVSRYEALLNEGHSSRGAVSVLVKEFRPISNRSVEMIVNRPVTSTTSELEVQGQLF